MIKKTLMILVMAVFISAPVLAGNTPEFDCVGDDSANYFNDAVRHMVVDNVDNSDGLLINLYSDFSECYDITGGICGEGFENSAGPLSVDSCFPEYRSAMVDTWNEANYCWQIVLQMKPESDLDLNIRDCVMKHNMTNVWMGAEQTGRYRAPWGQLFFIKSANPSITVEAYSGPWSTGSFGGPDCNKCCGQYMFTFDSRLQPTLEVVALKDLLYTSKALWEESLVMVMPTTGSTNMLGETTYNLKHGDIIDVKVVVPYNSTCDIRYGADNVVVEYIGIVGTEITATEYMDAICNRGLAG